MPTKEIYQRDKEYYNKYRQEHREEVNQNNRRYDQKVRYEVLTYYSNGKPQCAICGEPDPLVLSIDHIDGGGNLHRTNLKRKNFNKWLQKQGYPEGFQVLCYNCNIRKYHLELMARNMEGK